MSGPTIKHMAFAVRDAYAALKTYQDLLGVGLDAQVQDYPKSRNRVAIFTVGGIEYQLCQSLDPGGRFDAWIQERGYEGLHHICYAVPRLTELILNAADGEDRHAVA
jgi:methylmalonyl-CoA/ethylmalonyl-CoA epimerase